MTDSVKTDSAIESSPNEVEVEKPKFSQFLTSPIIAVTVANRKTFYIHSKLLTAESETDSKSLNGEFKEAKERAVDLPHEDPDLFGFFVEYLYRDQSILSRKVQHYTEYETLARLYALGDRRMALSFKACALWRFGESLSERTTISDESICELLRIACGEIVEWKKEDPMRAHIFWYAGTKISNLQKSDMFRRLLCDIPELGKHLCLWVGKGRPEVPTMPHELQSQRFAPESEYAL